MTILRNPIDTQLQYKNQYPSAQADAFHSAGSSDIDELIQDNPKLWRGCDMAGQGMHGRSTGFTQLDAILPGRGWPEKAKPRR